MDSKRIFISYKRHTEHDQPLAQRLHVALEQQGHSVFIDHTMLVGENWVKRIQQEVAAADFLLLLLSEHSVQSSMVVEEVRMAVEQRRLNGQRPTILPVRVGFEGTLPYDLGAWLNPLNYALWRSRADDEALIAELLRAVAGVQPLSAPPMSGVGLAADIPLPSANPRAALEAPEGTIAPTSPFYVERLADAVAHEEQQHEGYTLTIQAARQMGKSSLLGRVMARTRAAGKKVAFIDFQRFGTAELQTVDSFFHQFCYLIAYAVRLQGELGQHWSVPLSPVQKATFFMESCILPACEPHGMLLALDEADALLDTTTSKDFFGMLRSWHNLRALEPAWYSFALAQVISTEPHMLINNINQSPFNVGAMVRPEDFTLAECRQLNALHGPVLSEAELRSLHELLAGHPYLVRKALYLLGKQRHTFDDLMQEATSETGPFGDHLRALLARLHARPELPQAMRNALRTGQVGDDKSRHRLIAGGLLKEAGGHCVARNSLYGRYLGRVL